MTDFYNIEEDKLNNILSREYEDEMDDDEAFLTKLDTALAEIQINNTDFYTLFNLDKECSLDDIKEAYKRLSRIFHPDRHTDPQKRQLAQQQFQSLQKAYEVLSDPNKRVIYDTYGEKALNMPWTVGHLLKTPEQLRKEYEKMAQKKREQEIENMIKIKTSMEMTSDISPLFHYSPGLRSLVYGINRSSVQRIFLKHSYQSQINDKIQLTLTGTVLAQQGRGGGNIGATIRHTISPKLVLEYGMSFIKTRVLSLKSYYQPSSDSFINTRTTIGTFASPPSSIITVGRQLSNSITGFMSYNTGDYTLGKWGSHRKVQPSSSLSIGVASQLPDQQYQVEFQVGMVGSHLTGHYKKKIDGRNKLVVQSALSNTSGISAGLGAEQKILPKTSLATTLNIGYPSGVSIRISLNRLGQSFTLPIAISDQLSINTILFTFFAPLSSWILFNEMILTPWRKNRIKQKLIELKELNQEYLDIKKSEAKDAVKLFEDSVLKRKESERENKGLVILEALYGKFDSNDPKPNENCIDVTLALQNLVLNSQLNIAGGSSKCNILGFYDPCFGEPKKLYAYYSFRSKLHKVIVKDASSLVCPLRSHAI